MRVGHDRIEIKVDGEASGGEIFAYEVDMPAGGGPQMLHRHASHEIYRVVAGAMTVYAGSGADEAIERRVVRAGDTAFIPGNAEHTIRNETKSPARAFAVLVPGDDLERFVRGVAELGDSAAEASRVSELAQRSGIEMTRTLA